MHVAFLTPEYPHSKIKHCAGLGTSIKNLAHALTKKNVKITVFVYSQNENEIFEDAYVKIHKIAHKKYKFLGWYLYRKYIQNYVNAIIENEEIQILEAADWTGITALMNVKCKLLIRLHGSDGYFCYLENRKQKFKNYLFEKLALSGADKIVSVSQFTASKTKNIFGLKRTISVIYNGVNTDVFSTKDLDFEPNTLLYFGTIIRKKGVLELAHIFNALIEKNPSVKLTLLGKEVVDVFEKKSTLDLFFSILSAEARKQVVHIDKVEYKKVKDYIQKANVVVLPSFAEAFPMTWLEAMAMRKALVTSNIGWANELMIQGETGFTVNPKDHVVYANKIQELLSNKELTKRNGENARKRIENEFLLENIVNQNIKMYSTLKA